MAHRGMKFGIFLAPFHRVGENPTLAISRDVELLEWLDALYEGRDKPRESPWLHSAHVPMSHLGYRAIDESGVSHLGERIPRGSGRGWEPGSDLFGLLPAPIPYGEFKKRMAEVSGTSR